jgi:hypothetical protein
MANLATLRSELAEKKMDVLTSNESFMIKGGHHKGGKSRKSGKSKKTRRSGRGGGYGHGNGCGCGCGGW